MDSILKQTALDWCFNLVIISLGVYCYKIYSATLFLFLVGIVFSMLLLALVVFINWIFTRGILLFGTAFRVFKIFLFIFMFLILNQAIANRKLQTSIQDSWMLRNNNIKTQ